jgi:hypothetical protein
MNRRTRKALVAGRTARFEWLLRLSNDRYGRRLLTLPRGEDMTSVLQMHRRIIGAAKGRAA